MKRQRCLPDDFNARTPLLYIREIGWRHKNRRRKLKTKQMVSSRPATLAQQNSRNAFVFILISG